jgi:hypothetical protein
LEGGCDVTDSSLVLALDEFAGTIKNARDKLDLAVDDAIPEMFFPAEFDGESYEAIEPLTDASDDIKDAFRDFDWEVGHALRTLKQRLAASRT